MRCGTGHRVRRLRELIGVRHSAHKRLDGRQLWAGACANNHVVVGLPATKQGIQYMSECVASECLSHKMTSAKRRRFS
eukprot:COSAG06_NODE_32874_length_498_cov_72.280702_2_plen_77_part_01